MEGLTSQFWLDHDHDHDRIWWRMRCVGVGQFHIFAAAVLMALAAVVMDLAAVVMDLNRVGWEDRGYHAHLAALMKVLPHAQTQAAAPGSRGVEDLHADRNAASQQPCELLTLHKAASR
jgi:hypothetical protein